MTYGTETSSTAEVWDAITGMWCILHSCDTVEDAALYVQQEQRLDTVLVRETESDYTYERRYRVVTTTTTTYEGVRI